MATYQILSWHGIPTGVKAKDTNEEKRENFPRRFQAAVDAVATATGNIGTKAYLAGWKWSQPRGNIHPKKSESRDITTPYNR